MNDLARSMSMQTAETSDINQRDSFSTSESFREHFARLYGTKEFESYSKLSDPNAKIKRYNNSLNELNDLDDAYNKRFKTTNSAEIILEYELYPDGSLSRLTPEAYRSKDYPENGWRTDPDWKEPRYFTALAPGREAERQGHAGRPGQDRGRLVPDRDQAPGPAGRLLCRPIRRPLRMGPVPPG